MHGDAAVKEERQCKVSDADQNGEREENEQMRRILKKRLAIVLAALLMLPGMPEPRYTNWKGTSQIITICR